METLRLRAIQLPGNAGALLDCFIRPVEVRRYDESGAIEKSGTWVRVQKDKWQRCNA
jgi:hypothetical protein